ncbi:hypothetical protein CC78DRAFT_570383 [Lojkania enalia]|uniref:C2H2-type domain-containing protein n=1 Tax=Lojkania enalia TaxID=147567 RepID=A0A9P4N0S7_9PLEO|nr:hypothetical protein CC78DRAFT_570383 [Didymosphaeria enalia]
MQNMLGRQDVELQHLYGGNVLFYGFLRSNRSPGFLQRNLKRIFELHRLEFSPELCSGVAPPGSEHGPRLTWRMPPVEQINREIAKKRLIVRLGEIKPLNSTTFLDRPPREQTPLFRTEVVVWITFTDSRVEKKIHEEKRLGYIVGIQNGRQKKFHFDIPKFVVDLDKLKLEERLQYADKYMMMVAINFKDSTQSEDFYSHIDLQDKNEDERPATRLLARCPNIINVTETRPLLQLCYKRGKEAGSEASLNYGVSLSMDWGTSSDFSILATINQRAKAGLRDRQHRLPPREINPSIPKPEITWVTPEHTLKRSRVECIHCLLQFSRVSELRVHLHSCHHHFKYMFVNEKTTASTIYWKIVSREARKEVNQCAHSETSKPQDVPICAASISFDEVSLLNQGDEDREQAARLQKQATSLITKSTSDGISQTKHLDDVKPMPLKRKRKYRVPKAPDGITFFRTASKRPLEEGEYLSESDDDVDEEWLRLRKRHIIMNDLRIPEPAKRLLFELDEHIRKEQLNGDAHLGDAIVRFARTKGDYLWENDLVTEFKKKIDELLEDRLISADFHAGCVDIVNQQRPCPSQEARQRLLDRSPVIAGTSAPLRSPLSPAVSANINGARPASQQNPRRPEKSIDKGKAKVNSLDEIRLFTQQTDISGDEEILDTVSRAEIPVQNPPATNMKPVPGECLCGDDAHASYNNKAIVCCESIDCVRMAFHVECVMKHWKPKETPNLRRYDWYCKDCEMDPEIETGPKMWYS